MIHSANDHIPSGGLVKTRDAKPQSKFSRSPQLAALQKRLQDKRELPVLAGSPAVIEILRKNNC